MASLNDVLTLRVCVRARAWLHRTAYGVSKSANVRSSSSSLRRLALRRANQRGRRQILFAAELNERYKADGITAYSLHPGGRFSLLVCAPRD